MSAPVARTASGAKPLTVAWVPTGIKAGVATTPCGVTISPRRAVPSTKRRRKEKGSGIGIPKGRRHAGAMLIAALAYTYSRKHAVDPRFSFGTGKLGDLAAFASAIVLAMVAILIGYEAIDRLFNPVPIAFQEAIPIAFVGLVVNLVSA